MFNLNSWECLRVFEGHTREVICVKVLDAARIVSCSNDNKIKVWEIGTGECLKTIRTHDDVFDKFEILPNNKIVNRRLFSYLGFRRRCLLKKNRE